MIYTAHNRSLFLPCLCGRMAAAILAVCLLLSCTDQRFGGEDPADPAGSGAGYITLHLFNSQLGSRADGTEPGVNNLNENLISSALVCLMPSTATDDAEPVYVQSFKPGVNSRATVNIRLTRDLISQLFPDGATEAKVYVVANLPDGTPVPNKPSVNQLKALSISADFASSQPQPSFVMDGDSKITLKPDPDDVVRSSVSGEVLLKRAASKIVLAVKIADRVTDAQNNVWEPLFSTFGVLISNGVKTSNVRPSTVNIPANAYFSTSNTDRRGLTKQTPAEGEPEITYPFLLTQPFYTYPNDWTNDNEKMTYMTLSVQWKSGTSYRTCYYMVPVVGTESLVRNVSYRVNIDVSILGSFSPNDPLLLEDVSYLAVDWEIEDVNVQIDDFRYLVLDQENFTLNNEASVIVPFYSSHPVTVTDTKVTYYIYNYNREGNEEPVEITPEQNDNSITTFEGSSLTHIYATTVDNTADAVTATRSITFNHPLYQWTPLNDNSVVVQLGHPNTATPSETLERLIGQIDRYVRTDNPSFSRYDIEITFVQTDKLNAPEEEKQLYTKTIKITQYPGMYLESTKNFYSTTLANNTPQRANVYVNGNQTQYSNATNGWCTVNNSTTFKNPNMYVVTITSLNDNSYNIGDPRQETIDNLTYNGNTNGYFTSATQGTQGTEPLGRWSQADALSGNSPRRLSYYYPTSSSNDVMYRVAPKLRISSRYSTDYSITSEEGAKRRCAGYQEMGYAAGRWRLPTVGELQFIMNLWKQNLIPELFKETSSSGGPAIYWTAQGRIPVLLTDGKLDPSQIGNYDGVAGHIRCVYDEWYWEDKGTVAPTGGPYTIDGVQYWDYPFTWGDQPR